jgi:hypothetical protein
LTFVVIGQLCRQRFDNLLNNLGTAIESKSRDEITVVEKIQEGVYVLWKRLPPGVGIWLVSLSSSDITCARQPFPPRPAKVKDRNADKCGF